MTGTRRNRVGRNPNSQNRVTQRAERSNFRIVVSANGGRTFFVCTKCQHWIRKTIPAQWGKTCECQCHMPSYAEQEAEMNA